MTVSDRIPDVSASRRRSPDRWSCLPAVVAVALLCVGVTRSAVAEYVVGLDVTGDSDSGFATSAFGDVGITEATHLSGIVSNSRIEVPLRDDLDSWYGELALDHRFDPVGIEVGIAYWGDSDVLASNDVRSTLYWQGEGFRFAANVERRDFRFVIPPTDFFPGREIEFDADGLGLSMRFDITSRIDAGLSFMDYDYSVDFNISDRLEFLRLITASRLSLITSLVDYRASATLGLDLDDHRVSLDLATWRGEVDGGDTRSATLRWLAPLGRRSDIEFGLGHDDSELSGSAAVMSISLFFYGG